MIVAALAAGPLRAQVPRGATISGVVKDGDDKPVAGADVIAQPDDHRTRTDSAGHFSLTGLSGGRYSVRARKLGFAPAEPWSADVSDNAHLNITLTLGRRMPTLDTVIVRADRECSVASLDGFTCRRQSHKGLFLDYTDIDDKNATYTADIFRDIPGYRIETRPTRSGVARIVTPTTGWRCINYLVDGRQTSLANAVPEFPWDIVAMEIYTTPDDIPKEYERFIWTTPTARRPGRCSLVVVWTQRARTSP
jgi:hypothetical protein